MLSEYFDVKEFEHGTEVPESCLPVLTDLCRCILEPVRAKFGPLVVTSGYRPTAANAEAHGQPNSEHIYTPAWAAGDFFLQPQFIIKDGLNLDMKYVPFDKNEDLKRNSRMVFDWMRGPEGAALPFHQLILEHSANGSSVVHVSINKLHPGLRSVLEGATHNAEPYVKIDHVAYNPPSNRDAVAEGHEA